MKLIINVNADNTFLWMVILCSTQYLIENTLSQMRHLNDFYVCFL